MHGHAMTACVPHAAPGRTAQLADAGVEQVALGRVLQQVVVHALPGYALVQLYGLAVPLQLRRKLRHLRVQAPLLSCDPATQCRVL